MAFLTVEGIYKDGRVELSETPAGVDQARVMVVFLEGSDAPERSKLLSPSEREARRRAAFAQMREGLDLGGPPYPKREELYDRMHSRSGMPSSGRPRKRLG
jgi:hypothetical protein